MTYPSQPGYPTPQYGGQSPQPQQQNNLWLIGGAVLTVLIIIMTVILLVVQRTQSSGDNEGSGGNGTDSSEGTDGGGDDGGDDGGGDAAATELTSDACDAFDFTKFEETYGPVDPDQSSRSESNYGGMPSVDCSFYNAEVTGVNLSITDYENASDVIDMVEYDAEYYTTESGYELVEYTEMGDAGSYYTMAGEGYKQLNLHIAFGSLDVSIYTSLWESENIDEAAAKATLEDIVAQCSELFADYT
ncbi:hypothetical protein [Glycomyces sp. NPDC021274]|uniref:hypothetical protein n=1 Tax=Glycomyces sp. NPDC021274 TaxID=3155120 RepID=UPI0033EC0603